MIDIIGKYNSAKVFTKQLEDKAKMQIKDICDLEIFKDSKIRIMPDVHAGAGCTIGTTLTIDNYVIPNLVGVDIGCGMEVVRIREKELNLPLLDEVIRNFVPSGKNVHQGRIHKFEELKSFLCYRDLKDLARLERSLGTLGGGNHFIEANKDDSNNIYIVVHTGSRNLGKQVADIYQNLAFDLAKGKEKLFEEKDRIIAEYKEQGRRSEIEKVLKQLYKSFEEAETKTPKDLAHLSGKYFDMYIHDMKICQNFATQNRKCILSVIIQKMNLTVAEQFTTTHNYIDMENMILRKGAVSAKQGEKLIIPINMSAGSLICVGKGNADWNMSAPHGAGRIMSRTDAKNKLTMEDYTSSMKGIYTTSVNEKTLDEAPNAYKPINEIIENVKDTVDIIAKIVPIYNFKSGE